MMIGAALNFAESSLTTTRKTSPSRLKGSRFKRDPSAFQMWLGRPQFPWENSSEPNSFEPSKKVVVANGCHEATKVTALTKTVTFGAVFCSICA
jgi:hypothetical protein